MHRQISNLRHRQLLGCAVAVLLVALALGITQWLQPNMRPTPLFFAAVLISTWYGGLAAGALASLMAVAAIDYFLLPPLHELKLSLENLLLLLIFMLTALLIDYESRRRRRAEAALRRALEDLDSKVQERTQALAAANASLQAEIRERAHAAAALSESEQRYKELFENANDMVYTLDLEGNLTGINRAGERITGYSRDEMMGKAIAALARPEELARLREMMERKLKGEQLTTYELEITAKDGRRVILEISSRLIVEAGHPVGIQGSARDITERKQTEAALRLSEERHRTLAIDNARLYREAQEANRLKDEFLATVSHELRTPLNAIMGWAEMLRAGRLDAETTPQAYETIVRNAKAQAQIIDDILDVSRIITGQLRLDAQPVELAAIISSVVETVRPAALAKQITLDVALDEAAGAVSGDAGRLQQVAWNLLSNALKFTPENGRVSVRLDREGAESRLTVSDSGCGIKPEFLPHVFDRFRQADSSYTRRHGGLGLGLAIVRHLVEMHGGTVAAASAGEGHGASFTVKLPLLPGRMADYGLPHKTAGQFVTASREASANRQPPAAILNGLWLLVVDDDRDARELIAESLGQRGATITIVASVTEAMAVLADQASGRPPDVLLSDIGMPGEDGLDLIQKLRASAEAALREMPAIALTAYARPEDCARALAAGYQMHVAKPFDTDELARAIVALAERHQGNGAAQ